MNILFLSIGNMKNLNNSDVYTDLVNEFAENSHKVSIICARERREGIPTSMSLENNINVLRVKTGNITKTNLIEKGISTLLIEKQFLLAIKKYYNEIKFDLVIYSTPPITFSNVIKYVKKRDNAKTYLLLKDIFPQNAVDLEMFSNKSIIYQYFKNKEKNLYNISDHIGCMSKANAVFLLKHNVYIAKNKVEICPNSVKICNNTLQDSEKLEIRSKYNIPPDKTVFIYGGNLGKPQGADYLLDCLNVFNEFVIIVGSGTEYKKIKIYIEQNKLENIRLINFLPTDDYDKLVLTCDIGLIFLDKRFTIPNFPSRLLSYMQASLPVFAITDVNTDIEDAFKDGDFGVWSEAGKIDDFKEKLSHILKQDLKKLGENSKKYLMDNYTTKHSYDIIMKHFER